MYITDSVVPRQLCRQPWLVKNSHFLDRLSLNYSFLVNCSTEFFARCKTSSKENCVERGKRNSTANKEGNLYEWKQPECKEALSGS